MICHTMRGAKIKDIAPNGKHLSTKQDISEIILHVRINNTSDNPKTVDDFNDLRKSITKRKNWGFIDNGHITSNHFVSGRRTPQLARRKFTRKEHYPAHRWSVR